MNTIRLQHSDSLCDYSLETLSIINASFANPILTEVYSADVDKISEVLTKEFDATKYVLDDNQIFTIFGNAQPMGVVLTDNNAHIPKALIVGDTLPICEMIYNKIKDLRVAPKENTSSMFSIYYLGKDNNLCTLNITVPHKQLDCIKPNLYPDIDPEALAKEFIESNDNLLIVHGEPGTGKTSFIKYLALQLYKLKEITDISYAKDWKTMNDSQFWPRVTDNEPALLILDDLDHDLTTKNNKRSPFVSNLLSYLDGVLTNKSNKVIISTNQPIGTIDAALLRSGRCFDCLELHKLRVDYAEQLWQEMGLTAKFPFTKASISQAEFMAVVNNLTQPNKVRSYIKTGPKYSSIEEKLGM